MLVHFLCSVSKIVLLCSNLSAPCYHPLLIHFVEYSQPDEPANPSVCRPHRLTHLDLVSPLLYEFRHPRCLSCVAISLVSHSV
ncbi:hypothetical protein H4582DRAFT_1983119 [Lactarius indigo]|nr:hypothetical protein H4582DRAFT_1983119 [Lactarius indigo]